MRVLQSQPLTGSHGDEVLSESGLAPHSEEEGAENLNWQNQAGKPRAQQRQRKETILQKHTNPLGSCRGEGQQADVPVSRLLNY